jgi:hypothetical protein
VRSACWLCSCRATWEDDRTKRGVSGPVSAIYTHKHNVAPDGITCAYVSERKESSCRWPTKGSTILRSERSLDHYESDAFVAIQTLRFGQSSHHSLLPCLINVFFFSVFLLSLAKSWPPLVINDPRVHWRSRFFTVTSPGPRTGTMTVTASTIPHRPPPLPHRRSRTVYTYVNRHCRSEVTAVANRDRMW